MSDRVILSFVDKNVETFKYVDNSILLCTLKKESITRRQDTG
jgi:hypothetical protein